MKSKTIQQSFPDDVVYDELDKIQDLEQQLGFLSIIQDSKKTYTSTFHKINDYDELAELFPRNFALYLSIANRDLP